MRILILTEEQYPFLSGGGTTINKLLEKYCLENNIYYDIYCPRYTLNSKYTNKKIKAFSLPLFLIKNKYLRQLYKIPYILSWYISTTLYLTFAKTNYDVIFVEENTFSGYFSLFLRKLLGVRICLGEQTPGDISAIQNKLGLSNKLANKLEKLINNFRKRADYIIYASRDAHNKYQSLNKNSIFLPNFIDFSKFTKKPLPKQIKNIGFLGRVCYDKRVDLMINCMEDLPNMNLILIGSGPPEEQQQLKALVQQKNLKNVFFKGYTQDANKALDEVDILLMLWEKESFGISALEAMSKSIPVIAADVQEMHYFIGEEEAGIVLKTVDKQSVIQAIKKLSKDKKLYKKISEKAIKIAKDYDYNKIIPKYIKIFEKLQ